MTQTVLPIQTEPLNGLPQWPFGILAGVEGSGKTAGAIIASASEMVGRTFLIVFGEKIPHDYAAIPGQRVEVVKHDGTYRGLLDTIVAVASQPRVEETVPNLIVLDSITKVWHLLSESAQESANARARRNNKYVGEDGADIGRDLWNLATQRFEHIVNALKEHDGPVLVTARLDQVSGTDENTGQPTREKFWRVESQKRLPYEADFIVQFRAAWPLRDNHLGKIKQWGFEHKTKVVKGKEQVDYEPLAGDFTVEWLWKRLGLEGLVQKRDEQRLVAQTEHDQSIRRDELLAEVMEAAAAAGVTLHTIAADWAETHNGQRIDATTDLGGLELLRDDLNTRAQMRAAEQAEEEATRAPAEEPAHDAAQAPAQDARTEQPAPAPQAAQPARTPAATTRPRETPQQVGLRKIKAELDYQASVLDVQFGEYVKSLIKDPDGDLNEVSTWDLPPMPKWVAAQRAQVIAVLRDTGRSTEAAAYEEVAGDHFIDISQVIDAAPPVAAPVG